MNTTHAASYPVTRLVAALAGIALVAGCASIPEPLDGNYSEEFYPNQATDRSLGANVRWGGVIVETRPEQDQTCIEILAQALDSRAHPRRSDDDFGRFITCKNEFIDPEIFVNGREVTTAGRLSGFRQGKVGEFDYEYPVVNADAIYLWPERVLDDVGYYPYPYHRGFWPYYYGWRYYPYYFRPYPLGGYHLHGGRSTAQSGSASSSQK